MSRLKNSFLLIASLIYAFKVIFPILTIVAVGLAIAIWQVTIGTVALIVAGCAAVTFLLVVSGAVRVTDVSLDKSGEPRERETGFD